MSIHDTLNILRNNNSKNFNNKIDNILMLDEEKMNFIGDCCFRFNKLKYIETFIGNASIHLNYTDQSNQELYECLLKNNPHVNSLQNLEWDKIEFDKYDKIFCISYKEEILLDYLHVKYSTLFNEGKFNTQIYSISELVLKPDKSKKYIFPEYPNLIECFKDLGPGELYLSQEEKDVANKWLMENGLKEGEQLFIMVDSSSARTKLLNISVYFELLTNLLSTENIKILIFDEGNIGKDVFYREWLGDKNMSKMIFSKGFSLRKNLALLGSRFTKMIFGPCTGIMHCSSSIYNNYLSNGMNIEDVPLMVTYTGVYGIENMNADFWWGSSPLINCLLLKQNGDKKEIMLLEDMNDEERKHIDSLACAEYSTTQLINFVRNRLSLKAETKISV